MTRIGSPPPADEAMFEIFPWTSNLEVGIASIDEQHRVLVDLLNRLAAFYVRGASESGIREVLDALAEYAQVHFDAEERIWAQGLAGDVWFEEHARAHAGFDEYVQRLRQGETRLVDQVEEIFTYLTRWLAFHILDSDRRMTAALRAVERGATSDEAHRVADATLSGEAGRLVRTVLTMYDRLARQAIALMQERRARARLESAMDESRGRWRSFSGATGDDVWEWRLALGNVPADDPGDALDLDAWLVGPCGADGWVPHPEDSDAIRVQLSGLWRERREETSVVEYRLRGRDGRVRWMRTVGRVVERNADGSPARIIGSRYDVSAEALARLLGKHGTEGLLLTDGDGRVLAVNDALEQTSGVTRDALLGRPVLELFAEPDREALALALARPVGEGLRWRGEVRLAVGGALCRVLQVAIHAEERLSGALLHDVWIARDITEQRELRRRLSYVTHHDGLTGLPNRATLVEQLREQMLLANRTGTFLALVCLDLDGFAAMNALHGEAAGDAFLVALSARLVLVMEAASCVARLGGDEFAVLIPGLRRPDEAIRYVLRLLESVSEPIAIDGAPWQVTCSAGVATFPQGAAVDAEQLMRQADQAMYHAKLQGKNRFEAFDPTADGTARARYERIESVRAGLAAGEFELYYQPKVVLRTGELLGLEALIRWNHPSEGLLAPGRFLPAIEDHPVQLVMGEWVLRSALDQLVRWSGGETAEAGFRPAIAVNVCSQQLQDERFAEWVEMELARHPEVQPGQLELELVESSAIDDIERVSALIERLAAKGVTFALDDFGTGYSSLTMLHRLPVGLIKIDQAFVRTLTSRPSQADVIHGILGLTKNLHLRVLAEGVEDVDVGERLIELGCEAGQGHAIARPMQAHEVMAWFGAWKPPERWRRAEPLPPGGAPLVIASWEHEVWLQAIDAHLADASQPLPPLDGRACRVGRWLRRSDTPRLFGARAEYERLLRLHDEVHRSANRALEAEAGSEREEHQRALHRDADLLLEGLRAVRERVRTSGAYAVPPSDVPEPGEPSQ